jgi:hypothetical protein
MLGAYVLGHRSLEFGHRATQNEALRIGHALYRREYLFAERGVLARQVEQWDRRDELLVIFSSHAPASAVGSVAYLSGATVSISPAALDHARALSTSTSLSTSRWVSRLTNRLGSASRITGQTEFLLQASQENLLDTSGNDSDRGYAFDMDNEIVFRANGSTDAGVNYGSKIEVEMDVNGNDVRVDEAVVFFSGGFGRIELGREDGAEDIMFVDAGTVSAGTGGVDGDTANLGPINVTDSGDATKVTYYTPRIAGFQFGLSFTPDTGDGENFSISGDKTGDREAHLGAGLNWTGQLIGLDLTVAGIIQRADHEPGGGGGSNDDQLSYGLGATIGIGGFSIGGSVQQDEDYNGQDDQTIANIAGAIGIGNGNVSLGYNFVDDDADDDSQHIVAVSFDYPLMPGVTFKADVANNNNAGGGDDQDNALAGVASVQVDW